MKSIISKSLFAFAGLALCASCASHTLTTTVKMGYGEQLGEEHSYKGTYYTVVKYTFSAIEDGCKIKASNFSINSNNITYKGESFVTSFEDGKTYIKTIASEIQLDNSVLVMYKNELSYTAKDAVGTINNTTGIKINTTTSITFKW